VGHGLLDRLRAPYRALTAKVLVVDCAAALASLADCDQAAAAMVSAASFGVATLTPLPVAALPGWDVESLGHKLFDDVSVFRPKVLRCPATTASRAPG
jgi:hypothetical protein